MSSISSAPTTDYSQYYNTSGYNEAVIRSNESVMQQDNQDNSKGENQINQAIQGPDNSEGAPVLTTIK